MTDQMRFQRNRFGDSAEEHVQIKEKELTEKVRNFCAQSIKILNFIPL